MQPLRVFFIVTGFSPFLIQLQFLILLLFAGSLSTVPTAVPAKEHVQLDEISPSPANPPPIRLLPTATPNQLPKPQPFVGNNSQSESYDLEHSVANKAEATVDLEDGDEALEKPTESTAQTSTVTSSIPPSNVTASTEVITSISNTSATDEPTSASSTVSTTSTTSASTTSSSTAMTTTDVETTTTMTTTTTKMETPIPAPETDPAGGSTAKALNENNGSMSTGVVALITMSSFAGIAIAAYVSLIVWRRYLEYRYGNRELLVNNLEFDTNDLRHFEL